MNNCFIEIGTDLNVLFSNDDRVRKISFKDNERIDKFFRRVSEEKITLFIYGKIDKLIKLLYENIENYDFKLVDLKALSEVLVGFHELNLTRLYRALCRLHCKAETCKYVPQMMEVIWQIYSGYYDINLDFVKNKVSDVYLSSDEFKTKIKDEKLNVIAKNQITKNQFKQYIFIDLEYSNCLGGLPKICELSYVMTDTKFNILEQKEFVINPGVGTENEFCMAEATKDIHLKYEDNDFQAYKKAPEFNYYLDEISKLFSKEDTVVFFFSPLGDIVGLKYAFLRYGSTLPNFILVDSQLLYKFKYKHRPSLSKVTMDEYPENAEDGFHSSLVDAYWTMMITKRYVEDYLEGGLSNNIVKDATYSASFLADTAYSNVTKVNLLSKYKSLTNILGEEKIEFIFNTIRRK